MCLLLFMIITAWGCVQTKNPNIERGSDYNFREGYPDVRLSAHGYLNLRDEAVIEVTTDIGYSSLVFRNIGGNDLAVIELAIRVANLDTGETENILREFEIESEVRPFLLNQQVFTYTEEIPVEPGRFTVVASVKDTATGREIIRQTDAYIPDPDNPENNLTAIRLSGKNLDLINPEFIPITTYDVTGVNDSLRFEFQVTNHDTHNPLTIISRLLFFPADLQPALPMSHNNHIPNTLPYKGIDYRNRRIADETTRVLDQPGSVLIEFKYPLLERGNYRFEVRTVTHEGNELFKARDFAIRSENYPTLITPHELAEPLIYLMNGREYEQLMSINDPDSLKEAMDRFWLNHLGSIRDARDVINLFYTRVEYANKQFTNFKEGWKTDRGMIYILYGAPWYIETRRNSLIWSYTHNFGDPQRNFEFFRHRSPNEFFPFDHYMLSRRAEYHALEHRQKQIWLSGTIIHRSL